MILMLMNDGKVHSCSAAMGFFYNQNALARRGVFLRSTSKRLTLKTYTRRRKLNDFTGKSKTR